MIKEMQEFTEVRQNFYDKKRDEWEERILSWDKAEIAQEGIFFLLQYLSDEFY